MYIVSLYVSCFDSEEQIIGILSDASCDFQDGLNTIESGYLRLFFSSRVDTIGEIARLDKISRVYEIIPQLV